MLFLRGAMFTAFMAVSITIMGIVLSPLILFGERIAQRAPQFWSKLTLGALKFFCGVSHDIDHPERLPTGGAIVAANHQSMWETIALVAILPSPIIILKKELLYVPMYGLWARAGGNIAVDREAGAKALRKMAREAAKKVEDGHQVVVFPEGTRTSIGEKAPLLPGVAGIYSAANAPCIPIGHDSGRFWIYPGVTKKPGVIKVRVGEEIPPGLSRKTFLKRLADDITKARPDLTDAPAPLAANG